MILTRTEYGTDGNVYELSISNGEEYKTQKMIPIDVLDKIRAEILNFKEKCNASDYLGCGILEIIDKYKAESEDKCKNCKYYRNPDYTRCHKCKEKSEDKG